MGTQVGQGTGWIGSDLGISGAARRRGGPFRARRYDVRVRATVVTLFPDLLRSYLGTSVMGRAVEEGLVQVETVDLRAYGEGTHRVAMMPGMAQA